MARLYAGTYPLLPAGTGIDKLREVFPLYGKAAPAADEQGHAEAGGFLADHVLHAGGIWCWMSRWTVWTR